jgi:hypothetical protein
MGPRRQLEEIYAVGDLIEPSREHLELVPHMAQVDAQHALLVFISESGFT